MRSTRARTHLAHLGAEGVLQQKWTSQQSSFRVQPPVRSEAETVEEALQRVLDEAVGGKDNRSLVVCGCSDKVKRCSVLLR